MPGVSATDDALAAEARVFSRYLVGQPAPEPLVARYAAASRALFPEPLAPRDASVVAFACRHPWSVGLLDGASGLLRPGGPLRNRILLMAALLETTTEFADRFLPRQRGPLALVLRVGATGILAVIEAALGACLYPFAARSRA